MPNTYFQFKQFLVNQEQSGMKVTTDACLFGAWVANQLVKKEAEPKTILDIGTGTGLLSLMLAQVTEKTQIDAVEINEDAFTEASQNFAKSPWRDRLNCIHGKVQDLERTDSYDLIICNPPFFSQSQKGKQEGKNQALHNDDLTMEDLSQTIAKHLEADGLAYILFPKKEMITFVDKAKSKSLHLLDLIHVKDRSDTAIFRSIGCFGFKSQILESNEMVIKTDSKNYTATFSQLLSPYYLGL